jgi:hypothetical protein
MVLAASTAYVAAFFRGTATGDVHTTAAFFSPRTGESKHIRTYLLCCKRRKLTHFLSVNSKHDQNRNKREKLKTCELHNTFWLLKNNEFKEINYNAQVKQILLQICIRRNALAESYLKPQSSFTSSQSIKTKLFMNDLPMRHSHEFSNNNRQTLFSFFF